VPDRPAVFLFQSFVAAIDGQHNGVETSRQDSSEPGMHRLSGKAAMMLKSSSLVLVQWLAPSTRLTATARTSDRREAPHRSQILTVVR
jgi:hypothetical protein